VDLPFILRPRGGPPVILRPQRGRKDLAEGFLRGRLKPALEIENKAKRDALDLWVRGVNAHGGFGVWSWDVAFEMAEIRDVLARHAG
jgi:hypothetical protein